MSEKVQHHGRAVKRIREILHMKQDTLAMELGISQQSVSTLESKPVIDPETLEQIASILKVPVDAIKEFDENAAISFISNTFTSHDNSATLNGYTINYNPIFNPIEKWLEAMEENKQLNAALLKEKDEKIALLERLLNEKKK